MVAYKKCCSCFLGGVTVGIWFGLTPYSELLPMGGQGSSLIAVTVLCSSMAHVTFTVPPSGQGGVEILLVASFCGSRS